MTRQILALWTVPRSTSTAFERMMRERRDHTVIHEPFSIHYYFGAGKRSDRFDEVRPRSDPHEILGVLDAAARAGRVFVKDMAYHVRDLIDPDFLDRFVHTFLIRDPASTLPSLAEQWPDFSDEETGYGALAELVEATSARGSDPVIIDSDDLRRDPEATVAAYCDAVAIPYLPDALEWAPGMPREWELWGDWHRDVATSRGFAAPASRPAVPLEGRATRAAYDRCVPIYERLRELRLRPISR